MSEYLHYTKKSVACVDEFDFMERIKPSAVMEYFQDLATAHAEEIGIGFEAMKERNYCWVLNRLSGVITRSPSVGENITLVTYPHKPGLVDAVRDYYVFGEDGGELLRGTSRWCVLDIASKAVRRCSPLFSYDDSMYNPVYSVDGGNPQLGELDLGGGGVVWKYDGRVNITDLDRNGHMNNARYADMVVNTCDFGFFSEHGIKAFDFNFLSEMKVHDDFTVTAVTADNVTDFEAVRANSDKPVFRARVQWN